MSKHRFEIVFTPHLVPIINHEMEHINPISFLVSMVIYTLTYLKWLNDLTEVLYFRVPSISYYQFFITLESLKFCEKMYIVE